MDEWAIILNDRVIKRFFIDEGQTLTIGRGQDADVMVDNTAISRQHTSIELKGGTYYLTDLYSLNGTKVNGKKVVSAVPIKKTDLIEISKFTLQPAETLLAEETVESFSSGPDSLDETIFITSKQKNKARPGQYRLKVISGNAIPKELAIGNKDSIKVGRDHSCDMVISGLFLGKTQFFITKHKKSIAIIPQSGFRKTRLNGQKLTGEKKLRKGDIIQAGGVSIEFT